MEKSKKKRLFDLIQSAVALILSVTALLSVVFSWYALSRNVNVSGISLSAQSPQISIGDPLSDAIWVVRNLIDESSTVTYKKDIGDGNYYECHGGEWVLDHEGYEGYYVYLGGEWAYTLLYNEITQEWEQVRKSLSIKGIWPGESIDFFIPVSKKNPLDSLNISLRFDNISGDTFEDNEENTYSILGIYRVNLLDESGRELDKLGNVIFPDGINHYEGYDAVAHNTWLDIYNDTLPPLTNLNVISSKPWAGGEGQIILRFRITFDIAQIKDRGLTNVLSQKHFSIGRIVVTAN